MSQRYRYRQQASTIALVKQIKIADSGPTWAIATKPGSAAVNPTTFDGPIDA